MNTLLNTSDVTTMAEKDILLEVRTGCRLHFGLLELAEGQKLRFGGLGLMLEQPGWQLRFSHNKDSHSAEGHLNDDVHSRIERTLLRADEHMTRLRVCPTQRLALHHGLGAGTQLACAVAAGQLLIERFEARELLTGQEDDQWANINDALNAFSLGELAKRSGRGLRSAIGLFGFLHGGLILDSGYAGSGDETHREGRPITASMAYWPRDWRVVLIVPATTVIVAGEQEAKMLDEIGSKPNPYRDEMFFLATRALDIICSTPDFESLMQVIEEYTSFAATLFVAQQGGPYNGPQVTEAVQSAKRVGLRGVGQSSWGPAVFGFAPEEVAANRMVKELRQMNVDYAISICKPAQHGAQWRLVNANNIH